MAVFTGKGILLIDGVEVKDICGEIALERKEELNKRLDDTVKKRLDIDLNGSEWDSSRYTSPTTLR